MVDVYIPEQKDNKVLREQYFDYAKASTSDVLAASFEEGIYLNPLNAFGRLMDQGFGKGQEGTNFTVDEWSESEFYRDGIEVGSEGISTGMASLLADRYDKRESFRTTLGRSRGGFGLGTAQFGASIAASVIDPINIASAFIPSVTLMRGATMAARMGRVKGSRLMTGAIDGAIGGAVVEPLVIGAAYAEQDREYGLIDSFLNVTVGAALGGAIFYGAGKISDRYAKLPQRTKDEAQHTSVGQVIKGENVSVKDIVEAGEARVAARAAEKAELEKPKSPYDDDYEIVDFLDPEKPRPLSNMSEEELDTTLQQIDAQIETASLSEDRLLIEKLETDKEAIVIQKRRNSGETVERPAEPDVEAELNLGDTSRIESSIEEINKKTEELETEIKTIEDGVKERQKFAPKGSRLSKPMNAYDKAKIKDNQQQIEKLELEKQELETKLSQTLVSQNQAQQDVSAPEVQEPVPEPSNLGNLSEYSNDLKELNAQELEQAEFVANDIDAESNILLEEVRGPENLALLPKDARNDLDEIINLEAKIEKYETLVEAGRACIVRSKSG